MDSVSGSQAIAVVPHKAGTYLVRAEDAGGNPGPEVTITTAGYQAVAFAAVTTLTEDSTFTGAKSGVVASAGALTLDSSSQIDSWASFDAVTNIDAEGGLLPTGTYSFATGMNLGAIKLVRLRSVIDMSVLSTTSTIDARLGDIDRWDNFDGADGGEVIAPESPPTVKANVLPTTSLFILLPRSAFVNGKHDVTIRITAGPGYTSDTPFNLLGPVAAAGSTP